MSKKIIFAVLVAGSVFLSRTLWARENVTDWYIKDFDVQIVANKDSSLDITETITADCGNCVNRHGIFRILPTTLDIAGQKIKMPVKLLSITNGADVRYNYATSNNIKDGTVTWKIGDAKRTVQGVNVYVLHYQVQNAIRFNNSQNFDELYWNLNGNFWDLQADKFHAAIRFPAEVTSQNAKVEYYTGYTGSKDKSLATYRWSAPNVLEFDATKTLLEKQGITASVIFPKNIFAPHVPTFWEKFGQYLFGLLPLTVLVLCYWLWRKYGDDPDFDKTVIAQYEVPANLSPLELGMLMRSGKFTNELITAEIIYFATRGLITIKEVEDKILFFTSRDYELVKISQPKVETKLSATQWQIMESVFRGNSAMLLSDLKKVFYVDLPKIKKSATEILKIKGLIVPTGLRLATVFRVIGVLGLWLAYAAFVDSASIAFSASVVLSALILFAFSFVMPKRTLAGTELNWQIAGFKLFMETVDKDRAKFYEKENLFEKGLPYAIVFGMVKEWVARMQEIYGAEYFTNHAPLWYAGNLSAFDANNFVTTMDTLSSQIAANTSAPSGAGGAGGSGGGGGGGGGGGW